MGACIRTLTYDFEGNLSTMSKHIGGRKIASSHTSVIDSAFPIVHKAANLPEVNKIALGIIKQVGKTRGIRRLKFLPITGGWRLTVRSDSTVQEIYIYTDEPGRTKDILEAFFN